MEIVKMVMEQYPGLFEVVVVNNLSSIYFCDRRITKGKVYISFHEDKIFKIKSVYNPVQTENGEEVTVYVVMFLYTKKEYGQDNVKMTYLADKEYKLSDDVGVGFYIHGIDVYTKMDWGKIPEEVYTTYDRVGILRRYTIENIKKSQ